MKTNIRILDKTKKCNRRCSSCRYWISFKDSTIGTPKDYCSNLNSIHYNQLRNYWHMCKEFNWAENIVDTNDLFTCKHVEYIQLTLDAKPTPLCMYYFKVQRNDGKFWNHFPYCLDINCPIKHPELLQGENPID